MALDTQSKRLSAILPGMPFRAHLPIPDGTISQGDRQHLGLWCSSILFSVVVPGTVTGIDELVLLCPDDSECRMIQDFREVRFDIGGDGECRIGGRRGL